MHGGLNIFGKRLQDGVTQLVSFLGEKEILLKSTKLINSKPDHVELILTGGQKMHPKIKERADLLTEMKMIKHYYSSKGINARYGIEY